MEFFKNESYHIYNRGNNQQKIFFRPENYIFFLRKVRRYIYDDSYRAIGMDDVNDSINPLVPM